MITQLMLKCLGDHGVVLHVTSKVGVLDQFSPGISTLPPVVLVLVE